jgi:hypothetical protein
VRFYEGTIFDYPRFNLLQQPIGALRHGRRGRFSEQPHGCTSYLVVAGGCGDRWRARPDDADDSRVGVGLNQLNAECVSASVEPTRSQHDDTG